MAFEALKIEAGGLIEEVSSLKKQGYRFVTMSCVDLGESIDVLYHFDRELEMVHLRLNTPKGAVLPSISPVFLSGFLIENESKDHYGLDFEGLAIDFKGNFYLEDEVKKYPFCKVSLTDSAKAVKEGN